MEILAYPPRGLWQESLGKAMFKPRTVPELSDRRRSQLAAMVSALDALYEVEARLWAIPDKAEVLPGISCSVNRRPCDSVTVVLPDDAGAAEAASVVAAAKAVGVGDIKIEVAGNAGHLSSEVHYALSLQLPGVVPDVASGDTERTSRRVILGCATMPVTAYDVVLPRHRGIVMVAGGHSDMQALVADINEVTSAGFQLLLLSSCGALATDLPAMVACEGLTVALLRYDSDVADVLNMLEPQLIIAASEDNRSLVGMLSVDATVVLGPVSKSDSGRALLSIATSVVPVHVFTRSLAVIDPITCARTTD